MFPLTQKGKAREREGEREGKGRREGETKGERNGGCRDGRNVKEENT